MHKNSFICSAHIKVLRTKLNNRQRAVFCGAPDILGVHRGIRIKKERCLSAGAVQKINTLHEILIISLLYWICIVLP